MKHHGLYNITNVNTRVEKAGEEDGPLAVDINFENTVHRGSLYEIFDAHQIDALVDGLYNEDGSPRNVGVVEVKLDNEFEGVVRVSTSLQNKAVISGAKVKKFRVAPNGAGTFKVKGQIQGVPSDGDLEPLCRLQKRGAELEFDVTPFVGGKEPASDDSQGSMDLEDEEPNDSREALAAVA